ncbi:4Fe-4S dicluster domain-containing protein [Hydromonas duriensis]|uniref:4Fe-4S dicluster protein n=1 Tax=Hydromonas duriensis TaxID=1527608 RepID=A0A4R6Y1N8_9BURK|nr:4Fe-4S dicluster protein [Hydromonas duriensis]
MYLNLIDSLKKNDEALETQALIQDCVHCGMCLGSCPVIIPKNKSESK